MTNRDVMALAAISEEDKELATSIADKAGWTPEETAKRYILACALKRPIPLVFYELLEEAAGDKDG